jgi:hypothetical protein
LSTAGVIAYGIMLILESRQVRKGSGRAYSRNGQMRLQVVYEHMPRNTYDVRCPDSNVKAGSEVTVWAYGSEPWRVRSVGPSPAFSEDAYPSMYTPIVIMVFAVLLLPWYFLAKKK